MLNSDSPKEAYNQAGSTGAAISRAMSSAMLWNLLSFAASQGTGFVVLLIIATRLPPEIFGVVALASIVADFVATDGRYAAMDAVMQARRYDQTALNSSFASFFIVAAAIAIAMCIAAPLVSQVYAAPLISSFMPLFGLMILPIPWLAVMDALMMRDMRFREISQRTVASVLISAVVGLAVAFSPWFIWALLAQRLTALLVGAALQFAYTRWAPGLRVERDAVISFMHRFSALWLISALNLFIMRATTLIFGVRYDTVTVGLTRVANRITESVAGPIASPLMGLWFPLMSKFRGDITSERHVYNSILRTAAFAALPTFAGLALLTDDIVSLLLPPQYGEITPILQATAISLLLIPLVWFNAIAMTSLGMNRTSLIYTLALVGCTLVTLFIFTDVTPAQALLLMMIPSAMIGVMGNVILNRRLQQTNWEHYAGLLPSVLATSAMAGAVLLMQRAVAEDASWVHVASGIVIGVVVYVGWLLLFNRTWLTERIDLIRGNGATPH